jgi:tetratricopeptide (TPR) repeat protein
MMKPATPLSEKVLDARIWKLAQQGDMRQALAGCRDLNGHFPGYAPGWITTSFLALRANNLPAALLAVDRALELEPGNSEWLLHKARCLMKAGRTGEARPLVQSLLNATLHHASQHATLGLLASRLGLDTDALRQYGKAIELEPEDAGHHYNLATVQRFIGDLTGSEKSLGTAIGLNPSEYEAYSLRSQLRTWTPQKNHINELEALLVDGVADKRGEVRLHYALAKELEDIGEPQRSFRSLNAGAELRRSMMRYDVQGDLDTMEAIRRCHDVGFIAAPAASCQSDEPIFVLGMPRTGTTLVERIIGSHSRVMAAGELNNFAIEMTRLAGQGKPSKQELVERTRELDFEALGQAYINSTRSASMGAPRFIDKMPLNFLYCGLIHKALPQARIINLRRHPLDTCYAVYKTLFQDAYPFSYQLQELGRYYAAYRQLMEHWQQVIPGVIHTVDYEALVADPNAETRRLLDFCELPWEDQCLRFHENRQSSTTASASQVRQPMYRSSIGRWQDYREELQPLIQTLLAEGVVLDE